MSSAKQCQAVQAGRTPSDEYLTTLGERMPEMTRLFTALGAGITPNFLDIMAAISEMVAFHIDCDLFSDDHSSRPEEMSGNKCPFC